MMKVAGATDDDLESGEELLTDEGNGQPDEYKGNDAMGAPFYAESFVVTVAELRHLVQEIIKKQGGKYVLKSKHKKGGKRKTLGTHTSLKAAQDQEKAIHAHS